MNFACDDLGVVLAKCGTEQTYCGPYCNGELSQEVYENGVLMPL